MRKKEIFTEKRIALLLVVVLLLLSALVALRHNNAPSNTQDATPNSAGSSSAINKDMAEKTDQTTSIDIKAKESSPVASADTTGDPQNNTTKQSNPAPVDNASQARQFTVVAGDSFTGLARVAIAEYATSHRLELSDRQKLIAEVELTNASGSPRLEIDQAVTITTDQVTTALGASGAITESIADANTLATKENSSNKASDYTTIAVSGDTYTALVRQAIASIDTSLSAEQRVATETYLSETAGFPRLEVGQTVTITADELTKAIARAKALPADELASWGAWVK